jgi:multiple sugar transport system permease protein
VGDTVQKGIVKKRASLTLKNEDRKLGLFLVIPSAVIILGVLFYPIIYSFFMSLSDLNLETRILKFVGLSNYLLIIHDKEFLTSISLTVYFTIVTVIFEMILGICFALVLNKKFKGSGFLRGIMILPWALPSVVNGVMWKWIFNSNYGALNALLSQFHLISHYHVWLGTATSALNCMIYANVWKESPYVVLLVLAGLSNISLDIYEAARVDGSSGWNSFWKITFPLLRPVVIVLVITKTIWAIQTFDLPYILTAGGPANSTELISVYIEKTAINYTEFGYGSAMSFVLMLVTLVLCGMYIKLIAKKGELV